MFNVGAGLRPARLQLRKLYTIVPSFALPNPHFLRLRRLWILPIKLPPRRILPNISLDFSHLFPVANNSLKIISLPHRLPFCAACGIDFQGRKCFERPNNFRQVCVVGAGRRPAPTTVSGPAVFRVLSGLGEHNSRIP